MIEITEDGRVFAGYKPGSNYATRIHPDGTEEHVPLPATKMYRQATGSDYIAVLMPKLIQVLGRIDRKLGEGLPDESGS